MRRTGRALTILSLVVLMGLAVGPSQAQQLGASAGVVFLNVNGASIDECNKVPGTAPEFIDCTLTGHASGGSLNNFCRETVAATVGPVGASAAIGGCGVSVEVPMTLLASSVRDGDDVIVGCYAGAGIGSASYSPAPAGAGVASSGTVVAIYEFHKATITGALVGGSPVSAGAFKAVAHVRCDSIDPVNNVFTGSIN